MPLSLCPVDFCVNRKSLLSYLVIVFVFLLLGIKMKNTPLPQNFDSIERSITTCIVQ